jgi:hypothetical protein
MSLKDIKDRHEAASSNCDVETALEDENDYIFLTSAWLDVKELIAVVEAARHSVVDGCDCKMASSVKALEQEGLD